MRLIINDTYEELASWAASHLVKVLRDHEAAASTTPFVIALPSGTTALGIYQKLTELYSEGKISFQNVVCFALDEYCNIPRDHPHSQHTYMWKNFFSLVDVRRENVHFLDGNAEDREAECRRYEECLKSYGGLDFTFFSTGADGHVARNEPGSSLGSITRPKTLAMDTIEQLATRWHCSTSEVPNVTLTMGVATLLSAREVLVLFSGSHRAHALEAALEKGINHMFPVSAFQKHPKVVFVCDEDATLELRVKTVEYFKGLDKTASTLQPLTDDGLVMSEPPSKKTKK